MESVRQQKVARLLQKELAEIFRSNAQSFFNKAFVTVTIVRVSPDLGYAKVYLSVMAAKDKLSVVKMAEDHYPQIRRQLGDNIRKQVRIIPELAFFLDDSLDYAENIENLLKKK
ncbi:MAG: 30S ribosome-binding factor RbfA [Bacteroidia bacterium]|nr:30S ribosome-binding factor RbfA [Bacteroidia bacterium]